MIKQHPETKRLYSINWDYFREMHESGIFKSEEELQKEYDAFPIMLKNEITGEWEPHIIPYLANI